MPCCRVLAAISAPLARQCWRSASLRKQCLCNVRSLSTTASAWGASKKTYKVKMKPATVRQKLPTVGVYKTMNVKELAKALEKDLDHVFECLLYIPTAVPVRNEYSVLDFNVIQEVCKKSGVRGKHISRPSTDIKTEVDLNVHRRPDPDPSECSLRPPVVTIMGHVDHGKTTLLDYLRNSKIVDQEFGGITQHIGAFSVKLKDGKSITFLDTPGHAAFSAMRGRGAQVTDIIILVVAADDGVMPQTIESIKHAAHSKVPIIVAINKCDREEAEVEACMADLAEHGVVLEQLGGDVMGVEISALKGTNIDALQDAVIVQAELLDIKADHSGLVEGSIVESKTDVGRGKVASMLVHRGTLKIGDFLVANLGYAKARALFDEQRKPVKSAEPGTAVEVTGWKELPSPGDEVIQVENEAKMKQVITYRTMQEQKVKDEEAWIDIKDRRREHNELYEHKLRRRNESGMRRYTKKLKLEFYEYEKANEVVEEIIPALPLVIRADVDGSLEAIESCLATYTSQLCKMETITAGVGEVTENDVELANSFDGIVLAFNTRIPAQVDTLAAKYEVPIRTHNIIYKLIDDVKDMLNERIPMATEQETVGEAVVQQVFVVTEKIAGKNKQIPVAGCKCIHGSLYRNQLYKVVRGTAIIHSGRLHMLKHFKTEVDEIKVNMECGLALDDHTVDIQEGDTLICYEEHDVQPQVDWSLPF